MSRAFWVRGSAATPQIVDAVIAIESQLPGIGAGFRSRAELVIVGCDGCGAAAARAASRVHVAEADYDPGLRLACGAGREASPLPRSGEFCSISRKLTRRALVTLAANAMTGAPRRQLSDAARPRGVVGAIAVLESRKGVSTRRFEMFRPGFTWWGPVTRHRRVLSTITSMFSKWCCARHGVDRVEPLAFIARRLRGAGPIPRAG